MSFLRYLNNEVLISLTIVVLTLKGLDSMASKLRQVFIHILCLARDGKLGLILPYQTPFFLHLFSHLAKVWVSDFLDLSSQHGP